MGRGDFSFPGYITAEQASRLGLRIQRGAMTPEQIGIFLGYRVPRNGGGSRKPTASWVAKIEASVVAWLPALGGSVVLHEELGRTSPETSRSGTERYIDFRVPVAKPALFTPWSGNQVKIWRDPSLATWTPAEADRLRAEHRKRRAAAWGGAA